MEDILLAVVMLVFFTLGYYAAGRFGQFLDEIFQGWKEPTEEEDLAPDDRNQT